MTAAAVVEMQAVEEPNRVRMRLDNICECHILRDHTIASFAIFAIRVVTGGWPTRCSSFLEHLQYTGG